MVHKANKAVNSDTLTYTLRFIIFLYGNISNFNREIVTNLGLISFHLEDIRLQISK